MTVELWWVPFALAAAAAWAAILWPIAAREHAVRGRALAAAGLLAIAVVTLFGSIAGPHPDPRIALDPGSVVVPGWLGLPKQAADLLLIGLAAVAVTTKTSRRPAGGWLLAAFVAFQAVGVLAAAAAGGGMHLALVAALAVAPVTVFWAAGTSWASMLPVLRWALRLIVWPSLVLAVAGPSWAWWSAGFGRSLAGIPQLVGATEHPNALGPAAGMLLILEVAKPRGRRWLLWAGVAGVVLLFAQSRTAWFAVAVAALLAAAVGRAGWRRWAAWSGAGVLLLWLRASPPDVDLTGRPAVWAYAWQVFRDHPLIGAGPDFLGSASRSGLLPPELGWMPRHAHDQFLHTAAATGLLGLAALGLLLTLLAAAAGRAARVTGGASVALLGTALARSITEVPLSTGVTGFLLNLVLFAAVFAGLRDRQRLDDHAETVPVPDQVGVVMK